MSDKIAQATRDEPPELRKCASRLAPEAFHLPVDAMREGRYTDRYFLRAREILVTSGRRAEVTIQVHQRRHALVAGTDEALAVLKLCLSAGFDFHDLEIHSLRDGDRAEPWEVVMTITGPYAAFAHLETVYLGILSRRTRIATNTRAAVTAAHPKPVMYFPARFDLWSCQTGDGWAAHLAGAASVSTNAQASRWRGSGSGTMPHSLIAIFEGDTVLATRAMAEQVGGEAPLVALVDFDNDCVAASLAVAADLKTRLWGVRLDTSSNMVDRSLAEGADTSSLTGVNRRLVRKVREALDGAGFAYVRIVVSGGFHAARIRDFEEDGVPVDAYGVGSSLLAGSFDYTADVVRVNGKAVAKAGRGYRPNERLELVE